jgi:hypothetical protein
MAVTCHVVAKQDDDVGVERVRSTIAWMRSSDIQGSQA